MLKTHPESGAQQVSCLATGFYPRHINMTLLRDGQTVPEERLITGELLLNGDGTYQQRKTLSLSVKERPESHNYTCTVTHTSLSNKLDITWAEQASAKCWKFVDDLNVLEVRSLTAPSTIQRDFIDLKRWSSESPMVLDPKKCKAVNNNIERQRVSTLRLLGIYIQANLQWAEQVDNFGKKTNQRLFLLRRLKNCSIPSDDLSSIFTAYIRPTLEYASPVWHPGLTGAHSKAIENVQRRAVRIILGREFTTYNEACGRLGLSSLSSRCDDLTRAFATSLRGSHLFRRWLPPERSATARHALQ
ncbi:hypothetical protein SKAU_G00404280 [Synaphobranchus kaupii]|uniref:Ig-like domain-containing protein n=1 Tax=Synaphobranchus kaupii TaxID=118154 RepID=A0A9Q1E9P0_SYNKA|nr:hypothetical protein SKAU_G00404280 [Synaphobranchus kaupii]